MTEPPDIPQPPPKRARGRPRGFDRQTVLDCALELFWKRGYHTTTTRDLESSLGLSQSSLYNEFGSKQALLDAVLDRYEAITSNALLRPLEDSAEGLPAIDRFFADLADWVTHDGRHGCMLINLMAEDGATTESIKRRTRNYRNLVRLALRDCLHRAAKRGEVEAGDEDERASLLLGMVLGFNIAARGGASKVELKGLLGAVTCQVDAWRLSPSPQV